MSGILVTASWVFVTALAMVASAYFAYKQNMTHSWSWFAATWALSFLPLWAVVSRYSKNLVADAIIYDTVVAVVYYLSLIYFTGEWSHLRWWQYLGFVLSVLSMFLVKIK